MAFDAQKTITKKDIDFLLQNVKPLPNDVDWVRFVIDMCPSDGVADDAVVLVKAPKLRTLCFLAARGVYR